MGPFWLPPLPHLYKTVPWKIYLVSKERRENGSEEPKSRDHYDNRQSCVCMCVCACARECVCVHVHVHVNVRVCVHVHVCVCVSIMCACVHMHVCVHVCVQVYVCACVSPLFSRGERQSMHSQSISTTPALLTNITLSWNEAYSTSDAANEIKW